MPFFLSPFSLSCSDIASVVGKSDMRKILRRDESWFQRACKVEERLEKESWGDSEHDSNGHKKTTIASYALSQLS